MKHIRYPPLVGREVTTILNGILLYEKTHIEGRTGSLPSIHSRAGPVPSKCRGITEVQFRNIGVKPLTKKGQ